MPEPIQPRSNALPSAPVLSTPAELEPETRLGPLGFLLSRFNAPWLRPAATIVCGAAWLVKHYAAPQTIAHQVASQVWEACVVAGVASLGVPRR